MVKDMGHFSHQIFLKGGRKIGSDAPVFIIAEAGVAHFGNFDKALRLVDLAVKAKADAVKFQIFDTKQLVSAECQDWRDRLSSKELPLESFLEIKKYCDERGILFLATAHDGPSFEFLVELDVPLYKIGSGEVANWPFFSQIIQQNKPVFFSTGMYTLADVQAALDCFKKFNNPNVAVLHCVTSYPAEPEEVNLRAMTTMVHEFDVIVGYSDHTVGTHIPLGAVALGAKVIEKHITLDFNVPNAQDWKVSCGPHDFPQFVQHIREVEAGLGDGEKRPTLSEGKSLLWARKSLVARRNIRKGEIICEEMLCAKRPGTGIEPANSKMLLGKRARQDVAAESVIQLEMVEKSP